MLIVLIFCFIRLIPRADLYQVAFRVGDITGALSPRLSRWFQHGFGTVFNSRFEGSVDFIKGIDIQRQLKVTVKTANIVIFFGLSFFQSLFCRRAGTMFRP